MGREALPFILAQVQEIAGLDAALQLARARGGRRMYCPATPTPELIIQIGEGAANALSQLYPNEMINVPLGPYGAAQAARRIADGAIRDGASLSEAARLSGLTERTILNRKQKLRSKISSAQGRLFD